MTTKQKTIKKPVTVKGYGLHSGKSAELTFKPAPENHGYIFKRVDMEEQPTVHAIVENVTDTSRSTVLEENEAKIGTVEHVLAALFGMELDNILMELNGAEVPILDGSARPYADAIQEAGIEEQSADKDYFTVNKNISYSEPEDEIEMMVIPDDDFSASVMIDYNSKVLGNQYATLNDINDFREEIAGCRTFVFLKDLEPLLKHNMIKGGDFENAIVIVEREVSQEELDRLADLFNKPRVKVKSQGVLNNVDLAFSNEPARHKLLDVLGDLALVGHPIKGKILATRPGHASNVEFAKVIKRAIKKERSKNTAPAHDATKPPLMDIKEIRRLLPHRPPFLLVDKVLEKGKTDIVGIKNITMNEPFFQGHFPGEPVMPGVLTIEAMAQVGGLLVLSSYQEPEKYSTYFLKIDNIKFRKKVVPGDTLIFRLELTTPIRRGIANMRGQAFVGNDIVTEGEFMAQITKNKE